MSRAARILVIEDEPAIAALISVHLRHEGWAHETTETVAAAKAAVLNDVPDLILLDWMLPDASGIDFLRYLKANAPLKNIPVFMLTARAEEADKIKGLDYGADDYITKPFSPQELLARMRAALRRSLTLSGQEIIAIGHLMINLAAHQASFKAQALNLTPLEFQLLSFLAAHPNRTYSREQLLSQIWQNPSVEARTVDAHIKQLRKAMGEEGGAMIETVRGFGYRLAVANA